MGRNNLPFIRFRIEHMSDETHQDTQGYHSGMADFREAQSSPSPYACASLFQIHARDFRKTDRPHLRLYVAKIGDSNLFLRPNILFREDSDERFP